MSDATRFKDECVRKMKANAAFATGEVIQLPDGRAGIVQNLNGDEAAASDIVAFQTEGVYTVTKTASIVITDGQPVYWDHSANSATFIQADDRDFFLGTAYGDAASADTTMKVNINAKPEYTVDLFRDGFQTVLVGTAAAGAFGYPVPTGGGYVFELTATNEAQKVDALGVNGFDAAANWIVEGTFRVYDDGGSGAQDFSVGIASGTNATDFESVTSFVALHLDGNSTTINAESDDNSTDVAPTDTTKTYTMGTTRASRVHFVMDGRDPADIQIYINGVLVLGATTFTAGLTGTLYPIVHLEKTVGTDTYKIAVDALKVRLMQQDNPQR